MTQTSEIKQLTASPDTIRTNIWRVFGTVEQMARTTGLSRTAIYNSAKKGVVSDVVIGRLWLADIDPNELVRAPIPGGETPLGK